MKYPKYVSPYRIAQEFEEKKQVQWENSVRIASTYSSDVKTIKELAENIYEIMKNRPDKK